MTHIVTANPSHTCATPRRATLALYLSVWAERRALAKLDATQLADLGLSPAEARCESARSFWDLPCNRR